MKETIVVKYNVVRCLLHVIERPWSPFNTEVEAQFFIEEHFLVVDKYAYYIEKVEIKSSLIASWIPPLHGHWVEV